MRHPSRCGHRPLGRKDSPTGVADAGASTHSYAQLDALGVRDLHLWRSRIGRRFLDAGVGFGGGCLPKDIRAFAARAAELGAESVPALLAQVDAINLRARGGVVALAERLCGGSVEGLRLAVLGAAFKPLSDDVRDSPALAVARQICERGADVRVYDPAASNNARWVAPALTYVASSDAALAGADLVLHLSEWPEFAEIDPRHAAALVREPRIIDGRNQLDAERWRQAGWSFHGVGRGGSPGGGTPGPAETRTHSDQGRPSDDAPSGPDVCA